MAHEILEHDQMVSGRNITPWHELGEVTEDFNIDDLHRIMGWNVNLVRCQTVEGDMTESWATVRINEDDSRIVLGAGLSANYRVLQNNDLIDIVKPFVDNGCALETAGTLKNGQRVWILMRLKTDLHVGKDDVINKYIMVSNDHTGRQAARFGLVGIRVVCQNTLNVAESEGHENKLIRVYHQGNVAENLKTVASMLDHVNGKFQNYSIELNHLAEKGVNGKDLDMYVENCMFAHWNKLKKFENAGRVQKTQLAIRELFETGAGSDMKSASGTWYGAYQAVNNYLNHNRDIAPDTRLPSLIWGHRAMTDKRALNVAIRMAA